MRALDAGLKTDCFCRNPVTALPLAIRSRLSCLRPVSLNNASLLSTNQGGKIVIWLDILESG